MASVEELVGEKATRSKDEDADARTFHRPFRHLLDHVPAPQAQQNPRIVRGVGVPKGKVAGTWLDALPLFLGRRFVAMSIFIPLLFLAVGACYLLWPETAWTLHTACLVKGGEPTSFALLMIRIVGGICMLVGSAALIFWIFSTGQD